MLQKSKSGITEVLCRACEISFLGTRLISTDDVTDLQAFVLYLVSYEPLRHFTGSTNGLRAVRQEVV
jgi:hypothetical protein